ncbi:MAG: hypothetical protein IIA88_09000, partial [Bacteroidetes bacterium]|nr:hypothetical protein [Bacteroidota bacterium]
RTGSVSTPEHSFASYDLTGSIPGWDLDKANSNVWFGWMDLNRTSVSGWGALNYSCGMVLAVSNADFNSGSPAGYAVVFRNSPDELVLVKFSGNITSGSTNLWTGATELISSGYTYLDGDNGVNFFIEYLSDGTWKIYYKAGAKLLDANATNSANYSDGNATSANDETYTGTTYKYSGWVYAHSSAGGQVAYFDNFGAGQSTGNTITTDTAQGSPFCVTASTTVSDTVFFTSTGAFNAGNVYTAQLSDASGAFGSPTNIGTVTSTLNTDTIIFTIPAGTASGTGYRIRVIADDPATTGSDNGVDLRIVLGPENITGASATGGDTKITLSWTNPPNCYDEILVAGFEGGSVTSTPSGDGSAYTANTIFGSGTDIGTNEYTVYKATGTNVIITGLTNGTNYCFKIFTRNGTTWSSGVEACDTPEVVTILSGGDFAILGIDANHGGSCGGGTGDDEISFVCFKDIVTGTILDFTDNGWQRENANQWGNTEGTIRMTRTGATISAGVVMTLSVDESKSDAAAGRYSIVEPADAGWTFTEINFSDDFNMNSGGDQIYFMQGGTWDGGTKDCEPIGSNPGTGSKACHNATYTGGEVLFGFSTTGSWIDFGASTQKSGLYPGQDCFSMAPTSSTDFDKYTGPVTAATQRTWIGRINNEDNWTSYSTCALYAAAAPDYVGGYTITINAGGFTDGKWMGDIDSDWFKCGNWESLAVPDSSTNVIIPSSGGANEPLIDSSGAVCTDLDNQTGRTLTLNSASGTTGSLSMISFNNAGTFTHTAGTVTFYGSSASTIGGSSPIIFYNFILDKSADNLTMSSNFTVTDTCTLTDGVIITGTDIVILTSTTASNLTGYSNLSFVYGNLRRYITSNTDTFGFPLGDGTSTSDYHLVELINAKTNYNVLRRSMLPSLMRILGENRDVDYPQRIFEIGKVFTKSKELSEHTSLGVA